MSTAISDLFTVDLNVVNVGLESFAHDLRSQGVPCEQVTIAEGDAESPSIDETTRHIERTEHT